VTLSGKAMEGRMRILICDRTGQLPRTVRWEAQRQIEHLGGRTRRLEAADMDLYSVSRGGMPAIEAEVTVRTAQTPIRVAELAGNHAEAVERALQTLRSVLIEPSA
jgi:hypothetical protein